MDGESPSVRAMHLCELLDQCRQGISLMARENETLRQELGIEDFEDAPENGESAELIKADLPVTATATIPLLPPVRADSAASFVHSVHTDHAVERFTVAGLWKKAVASHSGSLPGGDLLDVSATDSHDQMRISAKNAANLLRIPRLPISPNSGPKLVWDFIGLFLICWDVFFIPLTVLDLPKVLFTTVMDWVTLCFWTSDIAVSFVSGFYKSGELVMDMRAIAASYVTSWFVVDLIVVVPDWITSITSSDHEISQNMKMIRAFRALRILRLLRLLKLQRLVNIAYDFISSEYAFIMIGMLRLVVFIVVLNHVIACGWFLTGKFAVDTGLERSWLKDTVNGDMLAEDKLYQYTTSLHWSLTQFTPASMEVSARNVPERMLSIAVLFFALITFSSFVGSITTSMTALRSMRADTKKQFWMLRRYLGFKKVPYATRSRIIKFLEFQCAKRQAEVSVEHIQILDLLSVPLQNLLQFELRKQLLEAHPFFAHLQEHMRPIMIRLCSRVLKLTAFAPEDVVFRPGEESTSMYAVQTGTLEYRVPSSNHETLVSREVGSLECLSEAALWTSWWHRGYFTCRSASWIGSIKPGPFAEIAKVHTAPWSFCRQYAATFVEHLNRQHPENLNDLAWRNEDLEALVEEAIHPDSLEKETRWSNDVGLSMPDMDMSQQNLRVDKKPSKEGSNVQGLRL